MHARTRTSALRLFCSIFPPTLLQSQHYLRTNFAFFINSTSFPHYMCALVKMSAHISYLLSHLRKHFRTMSAHAFVHITIFMPMPMPIDMVVSMPDDSVILRMIIMIIIIISNIANIVIYYYYSVILRRSIDTKTKDNIPPTAPKRPCVFWYLFDPTAILSLAATFGSTVLFLQPVRFEGPWLWSLAKHRRHR